MLKKLACWFKGHHWTCAAAEGIPATEAQLKGGIDGFYDYAKMYCKRCGLTDEERLRGRLTNAGNQSRRQEDA